MYAPVSGGNDVFISYSPAYEVGVPDGNFICLLHGQMLPLSKVTMVPMITVYYYLNSTVQYVLFTSQMEDDIRYIIILATYLFSFISNCTY